MNRLSASVKFCFAFVLSFFLNALVVSAQCNFTVSTNSSSYGCYTTLEDVVWSSLVNATTSGNDLNKSAGGNAWNAGAFSTAAVYNNGYLETVVSEVNTNRYIGLSNTNPDASNGSILFAVYLRSNGTLEVIESSTNRGNYGSYTSGDTIRITVERGRVKYYKNSTQLFSSNNTPTLPLYADASLNSTTATLKKVVIGNLSNGSFKATATTLGTGPSYQWKLNGVNVGTGLSTYTNTTLALNDVISCVLTPGAGGCSVSPVTSNNIRIRFRSNFNFGDFYITSTPITSGCSEAVAQVVWDSLATNLSVSTNNLTRIQTTNAWDGGAASLNTVSNNGYFQFTALETNKLRQAGLSTTNTNASNTTIQYSIQLTAAGGVQIQELGANRGPSGLTYVTGDIFKIAVESSVIKYYQNGTLLYISAVMPTLPLLVDVSVNNPGGTISNALVSNYTNGTFNAVATSAGASPTYQWKLNGGNVGSNLPTYTNTTLSPNDVVSCVLTPNLNGCSTASYSSNTITYKTTAPSANLDFYILGTAATSACAAVEEQVKWKVSDLLNVVSSSNSIIKVQSGGNWDGGAASWNTVSNNGYFQFTVTETNTSRVAGLSSSNANASNASVQYGFLLLNTGVLQIIESNANRGSFGSYASSDVLRIAVEANVVKYYRNGALLYISAVTPTLPMLVDVSINTLAGTVTNALVGNYSTGAFTAVSNNAGAAPIYQWKLNGINTGTNSATYTNAALAINDVVSCVLTPDLAGCSNAAYTSNTLTYKSNSSPSNIEFYIKGTPAASACFSGEEQVKWKISDLNYVLANGNSLTKFQTNAWDGGAASWNTVSNNGYFQFTATETNTLRAAGLSTTNANSNFNTIQYAFYLTAAGAVQIQESGTNRGTFGTYIGGDIFKVSIESSIVKYYQNGNLLYISTVAPTLPLLVDVSINTAGGTITGALIGNYSSGTYTATAVNAGVAPTYQWQVNGSNVGVNSISYTNTSLVAGDVVTCILTPNIAGCSAAPILANSIVNKTVITSNSIEFYIQGLVATTACNSPEEQVRWKNADLNFVQANGNNLLKIQSDGNWDGGAASRNTVSNNGYFQFTATELNKARMAGLSSGNLNSSYTSIEYAFYLMNNGNVKIYESNSDKGTFGTYATNDVFKILVDNNVVKYYQNGNLLYISGIVPSLPLLVDVSIHGTGGTITNAVVSNYNVGSFGATVINAGINPSYQWQVNGVNAGANSATYTNVSLLNNDVVTCILTPSLPGCSTVTYTSNPVTSKLLANPTTIDFYIQGTVAGTACNAVEEQVKWKTTDFNNVIVSSGNSLSKVQTGGWDGGAASYNTVGNNGYFQFTATETNTFRAIGLSTANTNNNYTSIQYAFYLTNIGTVQIIESNIGRGTFANFAANDVFAIKVESGVVKYYHNGNLLYISTITPTLPLLVDVSLGTVGSTITNPIVSNYNTGTFTASAANAGVNPMYQWKLNGANVGTNSPTYTNTTLALNDVVTCVMTPALGGCSTSQYTSNVLTNKASSVASNSEVYIQGAVATSACNTTEEEVVWRISDLNNLQVLGTDLLKVQSDDNWDGGAASWNTVSNNGYLQFTAGETNKARMIGLSSSNASASYTTIQYAFYLLNNGTVQIYESSNNKGGTGIYNTGDVFKILIDNNVVKYYQNGNLLYTSLIPPVLPMLVDVSIRQIGGTVTNAIVSNYNTGLFTATATNVGVSPTYQWRLNGSPVGTNSATYTNTALTNGDVIRCFVTPSIVGCASTQFASNTIVNKSIASPTNLEFYIQATPATSACNVGEEQVRWRNSDYSFVSGTSNNLIKVQSDGNWDGGAASWNTVSNNGYFQFVASETNTSRMAGLSTSNTNASYLTIQYAIYLVNTGSVRIFESGTDRGAFSTYAANDVFKISIEAGVVKYYQNGNLLYISSVTPILPLLVDVSIRTVDGTITNALVGNYSSGTFTATALNAGINPLYNWKVNGTSTGVTTATYNNASLSINDVISCDLVPAIGGCGSISYPSNAIINKSTSASSSIEFYIAASPSTSACIAAEEQVRWKVAELSNVQATGNNLSKVQSNGNWDGGAASWNMVSNNGYLKFIATETNSARMVGLSNSNTDANYTAIQYAFYLLNNGSLRVYEGGSSQGTFGVYNFGDTLQIAVEAGVVKYYQNSTLLYISSVLPTLPLLVDVSINTIGGTVNNAVVGNYNSGTFTASSTNAGGNPDYQWKLNGVNTGTNSATYTNNALTINDVVSCVLTPNLSGCGSSTYNSNTITNKSIKLPQNIDFFIQGTVAATACNTGEEQVRWRVSDLSNLQYSGNNLTKLQSGGNWDGGASSLNTVANNGYFQFTVTETNSNRSAGLSAVNVNAHFNTIQYGFYLTSSGSLQIVESGTNRGSFGTYLANDILKVAVEANVVKYYQNGNLLYISLVAPTLPMVIDVSINSSGGTITNAIVSNFNTGVFVANSSNVGASPIYQWKLNGVNTGTNSATYTNASLNANDVVTCVLTPSIGGCSGTGFVSNSITNKQVTNPSSIDFYIQATAATTSCNVVQEQVKWKAADLLNVVATANDLTKIQSNNNWDGGAASWNTVSNNGYLQFQVGETSSFKAVGLSTSNLNANYTSIQYAFYFTNNGILQIVESGTNRGSFSTYAATDTLKIAVESSVVKYYQNGTLLYSSSVIPSLPMLVDVSLYTSNTTLTNVSVGNYTTGTFTAVANNAGVSPVFQWKLNGTNTGANSSTYTNPALSNNDVVTCVLTPNLSGCTGITYASNSITSKTAPLPTNVEVYVKATPGVSACNSIAEEQVSWKNADLSINTVATNNNLIKIQSGGNWDGGAASWNTVNNNGYFQFTVTETASARMAGLSTANVDANYTSIQYAIYLTNSSTIQIYESGSSRGTFGIYAANDVMKVAVESNIVKYYKNNILLYVSTIAPTLPLLVDVSLNAVNSTITNAVVGNFTTNTFTATATNAGGAPTYQWKLNGVNTGTNSPTYTNIGLVANDQLTCVVSTNVAGCGSLAYTSNTVTEKLGPVPTNLDFYIKGTPVASSCNLSEEQVKWKLTDVTSNVSATANNLYKSANNAWDGGAASWNTVSNGGFLQFTTNETNRSKVVGLSTTNADAGNNSIQFGIFLTNTPVVQILESGTNKGSFGSYTSNDVFKIAVESGVVKYYKNGTLFYTSLNVPVLPLLVDVSIFHIGGTVTNALVSNYNSGTFTATALNAGVSPSYQWQLNGVNTGTNSTTYTNASLAINDVITCILTPNLAGCSLPVVNSNIITNKSTAAPAPIEFYVQAMPSISACAAGEEQVRWKASDLTSNVVATGNSLNKTGSNGNWDGGAASWNTVANNGYVQFTATETNKSRMIGLSATNTSAHYNTIQYAFYIVSTGSVRIYESGTDRGTFSNYSANDVFRIAIESSVVKYYKNGSLLYISSVTPTLPMLVDVSIRDANGTITNAVVGNLTNGSFTATALNAGVSPSYQWKLNGVNTGTNSSSYTNASLTDNDVVTCILTPDLGACGLTVYTSNTITNKAIAAPGGIDFYIQGTAAASACNSVEEEVIWKTSDYANVQGNGNNLIKIQSGGNWDGGAASFNTVKDNGYFQFTATETNKYRMAGLSSTNTNSTYTTIQYAFYLVNNSTIQIYESGNSRGTFGSYAANDIFKIAVEAGIVKYYQNGSLIYISTIAPTLPMLVDVSIYSIGGTITNAIVSNYNVGVFTAVATNVGSSPFYQWKLNGINTGTNSNTYTNVALTTGDEITCVLKPNLGGCSLSNYTSNKIINKTIALPTSIDFYIQGVVATSACNTSEEQVKWKNSDLVNVQATGNNLNKIQSNSNWDGGAASWNEVSNNGYFQFTATETNRYRMAGLSNVNVGSDQNSIQYAFYLLSSGTVQIQESGNYRGSFGTYLTNDVFKVAVEAGVVKYYKNNELLYISTVTPTLPMVVDVSIYNTGGTITDAIVANYNTGNFIAVATNAGIAPVYQWKVNGVNVGIGVTYSNTALNTNDVVTCTLTPNLGGCTTSSYVSNSITNKTVTNPTNLDFYIEGVVASSACLSVEEQVKWKLSDLTNVQATNNNLLKIQSNGNWDGGAASWNTVSDNGYFQFTATETNESRMAGLSNVNANSNFSSIEYAVYLTNTSLVQIYESGTNRGTMGSYVSGDVFRIAVEASVIKYYQNGNLLYISSIIPTLPMLVDISLNTADATITNALVSNYNTGTFLATAINAGSSPVYQWKLNGVNTGTNSSTYTNNALTENDVITCVLNPNLAGCNATTYTSNSLTNKQISAPLNMDFYIQGIVTTSACNSVEEQVKWKVSDLNYLVATGNSLVKVQSNGNWDGGAASWNKVSNNGYFQFTVAESTSDKVIGLSATNAGVNNTSVQFAFNLTSGGALNIIESGSNRGSYGNYATGDILKITVEAGTVKYYKNSLLLYISGVTPVLPMLVDLSIRHIGGAINNAIVSNYNTGTFVATAVNAGVAPAYQWKLNGVNVGSNSNTYINNSLGGNDVITCVLSPSLGGCTNSSYTSNSITNVILGLPTAIDFYILGGPVTSSCSNVDEQVRWRVADLRNVQANGNNLTKIQSGGNWNGGAASWNTVSNNGYFQFTLSETNKAKMVGLSNSNLNAAYTSIQYAFSVSTAAVLVIYESGTPRGSFGVVAINDVLKISVESNVVKYYKNGVLIYTSSIAPTLPLLVDVSINTIGGTVTNAIVSNLNSGNFTAVVSNAGITPTYQWKLNGANVGTNSTIYNNPSLTNNDVITCVLTPDLPGCTNANYTSNTNTYRATTIATHPLSQAVCTGGSSTLSVTATGNSLNYQWRKDGVSITGATAATYTISSATLASAGNYDVIVNTGGCTSNAAVITVSSQNQWSGGVSAAWGNTANWTCGILPTAATDVIIPSAALNMPVITSIVSINTLTINTSGALTNTAGTLNMYGSMVNNGTYTDNGTTGFIGSAAQSITGATTFNNLTVNNAAGLTLNSASTVKGTLTLTSGTFATNNNLNVDLYTGNIAGTGAGATTGNIRFFKTIWSNRYHYISSPIPGRTAADWNDNVTINFGANTNMYYYDETVPDTSVKVGWTGVTALSQPLQTMTGYALFFRAMPTTVLDVVGPYTHNAGTISSGTLTNTKSTVPTFKPASDGWNHLGNPYPSTIDWAAASGWTKTGVDNAVYFWDPRNNRFSAYVAGIGTNGGTRYIGSMQGFFVKVSTSGGSGSVSMTNAVRTSAINYDVWRTSSDESILRLTATSGTTSDETVIRLLDSTTTSFDGQYDAYKMMNEGQTPSLYTNYNADQYAINSIPYSSFNETIPVTLDAKFAGNYSFTADITGFEDADSVIFVDKHTNARQDLRVNPSYTVDLAKANYTDRFYIQYNKKGSIVTDTKAGVLAAITVYSFEQKVRVDFNNTKVATADLTIYDIKGNAVYKVKNQNVSNGKLEVNLPFVSSGVYIVKVESGQASKTQEVYITK